jgi:hypothetical protein
VRIFERRWVGPLVATSVILLTALVINLVSRTSRPDYPPVERAAAEALLDDTARLARDGDYAGLCRTIAASAGICRGLLRNAGEPGPRTPVIVAVSRLGESLVLHVRGERADGTAFTSDFQVSWTDTPDGADLRSRTPIYWSGVQLDSGAECHVTDGAAACTAVATAPSR